MTEQNTKETLFHELLEEEASVLEIARALTRQFPEQDLAAIQAWISETALGMAEAGQLSFLIDEFGAKDVLECELATARELLAQDAVWSVESDTMLHVSPLD